MLGQILNGNCRLLLIEQRECQSAIIYNVFCNLIIRSGSSSVVCITFNSLVQFPSGNRRTGQPVSFADFQGLYVGVNAGYRITIHINKVDCNRGILMRRIVEIEYVCFNTSSQDQCLFCLIREKFNLCQFRVCYSKRCIINRLCCCDNRSSIARNILNYLVFGYLDISNIFIRIQNILNCIFGFIFLCSVLKSNNIPAVVLRKFQRLAECSRTISSDGYSVFSYLLSNFKVRIRYDFIFRSWNKVVVFIISYIVNRVA